MCLFKRALWQKSIVFSDFFFEKTALKCFDTFQYKSINWYLDKMKKVFYLQIEPESLKGFFGEIR